MSLWKWIKAYWKGYTVLIATPEKHYRIVWMKGKMRMGTERVDLRGAIFDYVSYDEEPM